MTRKNCNDLSLNLPQRTCGLPDFLTISGTYRDEDIALNLRGLKVGDEETPRVDSMSLSDLESIRVLGKGNSAVVQLVQHKWTNNIYALKVISVNVDEPARAQLRKELKINHAKHDHVVECFQSFYSDGSVSLVLEYMDGGSLADLLKKIVCIPEAYLSSISKQALMGLHSLHRDHIIHRDIKPSNMLINRKGEVKISDFGVSTMLTSTYDRGQTFVGTYTYMSPERISAGEYSYNSDIWALGLSILECAIGRFPYVPPGNSQSWSNFIELLNAVVQNPPPLPSPSAFSPEFCSFISDCLQKDTVKRATAIQLLEHPFLRMYEGTNNSVSELLR